MRAVGGLCLDISLVTWGPEPVLYQLFAIQNRRSFAIRKKSSRNGSGSHVPGKTSRHGPPTALKLGSEDPQLRGAYALQVWWRPVSFEARTCGSGEVLCEKSTFISACVEQNERRQSLVWVSTPQRDNLVCFLFSRTIIVGLK